MLANGWTTVHLASLLSQSQSLSSIDIVIEETSTIFFIILLDRGLELEIRLLHGVVSSSHVHCKDVL